MPLVWALNVILNLYFGVLSNDSLDLEVENFNECRAHVICIQNNSILIIIMS